MVKAEEVALQAKKYSEMSSATVGTFEEFLHVLSNSGYHEDGHLAVGHCKGVGPMVFSQLSARDPIFWRWHKHISGFVMEMVNKILPG